VIENDDYAIVKDRAQEFIKNITRLKTKLKTTKTYFKKHPGFILEND